VQFTPDLMPSDVIGTQVFEIGSSQFRLRKGPVFTNVLLGDEINRAPAKTQSALLEAMEEHQVTIEGQRLPLPDPFFVIATQNPVEYEGTYPLPEAQLDRFLFKVLVDYAPQEVEIDLLRRYALAGFDAADLDAVGLSTVVTADEIGRLRVVARSVRVDPDILGYVVDLVGRTRAHPSVELGASPRATLSLLSCAQVTAAAEGRAYVVPDDVKLLAMPVLRHRVILQPDAELEGIDADRLIRGILDDLPVPGGERS
jgi:MoxR-like ATPase